ncbi:cadherin-like domain-containing protein [Neobacillus mesonae]|nr:cadherin-like domain-containing protein [Neobacillus mesonae]
MPFILRYNTTINGAVTFTGNTLGLNKVTNQNNQGNTGSIGAFSTLNTSVRVVNGQVVAADPQGQTLTYAVFVSPTSGAVQLNPADGTFTYTSNVGFIGTDTFDVVVTNSAGVSTVAPVRVIVGGDAPVASPVNVRTSEDQPVSGAVVANDPNGLVLTFVVGLPPANGMVFINPDGTFTYTPNPGFVGTDTFTVIVTNSAGLFTVAFATVTVLPGATVNAGPITTDIGIGTNQGQSVTGQILASSPAGLAITYSILQSPANGSLELNPDGSFIYIPNPGFNGNDTFLVTVTDSEGRAAVSTVTVVVYAPANTGGETTIQIQLSTPQGRVVSGTADGGPGAVYQIFIEPVNGNLRLRTDSTFTYIPNPGFVGTDTFTIRYTVASGEVYFYIVTVNVVALSNTVVIDLNTVENNPVSGDLNSISLGRVASAQLVNVPSNGRVTLNQNGTFTYIPDVGYMGPDQITFIVTSASGEIYTVILNILVVPGGNE